MLPYPPNNILFLDIETVPQYADYSLLPHDWKELWNLKASYIVRNKENETTESVYPRAGIYAEFGKIICIGCGVLSGNDTERKVSIKCFSGDDEKLVLISFCEMLGKWSADGAKYLCAHNGKEFDFPFLCRRLIVHQIPIPQILQLSGKKPWEVNHLDTLDLWKFGDFKSYTSLNLLAHTLGIPTPKDDIDGSKVWEVYWKEKNMQRIVNYCQKDVVTVVQIFLRMNGEPVIKDSNIEIR
jgi:predicted PolB exonuclease-like 3'-5' exonuclease